VITGSIGQFILIVSPFCPREPLYWTVFTDQLLILTARACSIGQFSLINSSFWPRELALLDSSCWLSLRFVRESLLYWTVLADWVSVLSARAALLDSSYCSTLGFVRESLLYWTVSSVWLPVLSVRAALLDSSPCSTLGFVRESRFIGQFLQIESPFCPWKPFYWTVPSDRLLILTARAVLLDSSCRLSPRFVHFSEAFLPNIRWFDFTPFIKSEGGYYIRNLPCKKTFLSKKVFFYC